MEADRRLLVMIIVGLLTSRIQARRRWRSVWKWSSWQKCDDPLACDTERHLSCNRRRGRPCSWLPRGSLVYQSRLGCGTTCSPWEDILGVACGSAACDEKFLKQRCKTDVRCVRKSHYTCKPWKDSTTDSCTGSWTAWKVVRKCNYSCFPEQEVFQRTCRKVKQPSTSFSTSLPSISCRENPELRHTQDMTRSCTNYTSNTTPSDPVCSSKMNQTPETTRVRTSALVVPTVVLTLVVIAGWLVCKRRKHSSESVYTAHVHGEGAHPQELQRDINDVKRPLKENAAQSLQHGQVYEELHGISHGTQGGVYQVVGTAPVASTSTIQGNTSTRPGQARLATVTTPAAGHAITVKARVHADVPKTDADPRTGIPLDSCGYVVLEC